MSSSIKALVILTGLLAFLVPLPAQIPAGYVQTTATVPALANGQLASSWTNLSSSPQLGLLGCVSTFQTTVNGRFDAFGHFAILLADTAQICPSPSTWTFTFTFSCTPPSISSAFTIQVPVTGGGGTEDISAQITARLPATQCSTGGGGGGGGTPAPPAFAVQLANSSASAFQADSTITINPTTHTFTAPNTVSNVQNAINIAAPPYNAKGDCSVTGSTGSCTDNCTPIQNAVNAAKSAGGALFIPMGATNPSIYYSSCAINPKGVSIYGPPGQGNRSSGGFFPLVGIRGAASLDVFNVIDPTAVGYVTPLVNFVWQDFGIIVNDSVDVSSTIAGGHRKPGKTCRDVTATNGSPNLTSASSQCAFNPGDVGQNISLTDGTNTLTTTILSVPTDAATGAGVSTAVMAANWTFSTHTNSILYIAIMGQSLAQRVGNVALAYDDTTNAGSNSPNQAVFKNMSIVTTSQTSTTNNSGAFFFQGLGGYVYASNFENNFWRTVWGVVSVGPDAASISGNAIAWGDNNIINNNFMESFYPWVTYGGKRTHWHGGQMAFACWGPQILEFLSANSGSTVGFWEANRWEYETQGCTLGTAGGPRIEGTDHTFINTSISVSGVNTPTQWDAFASKCINCTNGGAVNAAGWLNRFEFVDQTYGITFTDTGFGNLCALGRASNPNNGAEASLWRSCGAVNSRQNIAFAHTHDFVLNGNELTTFSNQADLWIWPPDAYSANGVNLRSLISADTGSESGAHMAVSAQTAYGGISGTALIFGPTQNGPNIPLTKVHVCIKWKLESGSGNDIFSIRANNVSQGSVTASLTTSYSTNCFDADLTAVSGQTPTLVVNPVAGTTDWAWISIHPWSDSENIVGNLTAGSVTDAGLTSGNCVQASTGGLLTTTSSSCAAPLKISNSITPAAATASQCVEQTFTYTGLATGQQVNVSAPALGAHIWIGNNRVSTTNTLAIDFCADATAGTPASGTYIAVAF